MSVVKTVEDEIETDEIEDDGEDEIEDDNEIETDEDEVVEKKPTRNKIDVHDFRRSQLFYEESGYIFVWQEIKQQK